MRPFIVAISGTSGSGKSSVVNRCAESLGAQALIFDNFIDRATVLHELMSWLQSGRSMGDWTVPRLKVRLDEAVSAGGLIVMEEPFGRGRSEIASMVDFAIHLHLPLEIAYARKMLRDGSNLEKRQSAEEAWNFVRWFSNAYLNGFHEIFVEAERLACESADLCIDATRSLEGVTAGVIAAIQAVDARAGGRAV